MPFPLMILVPVVPMIASALGSAVTVRAAYALGRFDARIAREHAAREAAKPKTEARRPGPAGTTTTERRKFGTSDHREANRVHQEQSNTWAQSHETSHHHHNDVGSTPFN